MTTRSMLALGLLAAAVHSLVAPVSGVAKDAPPDTAEIIKATKANDGVRLTMTLEGPLVAGQPARVRTTLTNIGDQPVWWQSSSGISVAATMPRARWRLGEPPIELPKYGEPGFPAGIDLKNVLLGECEPHCDRVLLDFAVRRVNGRAVEGYGSDMATTRRLAPGDSIVFVHAWDGDARLDQGGAPVGPPPDGPVHISATAYVSPTRDGRAETIKATLDTSIAGRDDALLHPFEIVDSALEDPGFADMMASRDFNRYDAGYITYVDTDNRWYVGSCGRAEDAEVQDWHLAEVDPVTGEVIGYIEGGGDESCDSNTWPGFAGEAGKASESPAATEGASPQA